MKATSLRRPTSLRWRLLVATVVATALALSLSGLVLSRLFADHVQRQFQTDLQVHLDHITAHLSVGLDGQVQIDASALSDPRMQRPLGGLYGQVQGMHADGHAAALIWRSRSLWDRTLDLPIDQPGPGEVHVHRDQILHGQPVLAIERLVRLDDALGRPAVRVIVAGNLSPLVQATEDFRSVLAGSLWVLFALLAAAAWAQVAVGLSPLSALSRALQALHEGQAAQIEGRFPREVQGLVDDFNAVLESQQASVERSRHWAGNLAHAIKTPLTVLQHAASRTDAEPPVAWRQLVMEQVQLARTQVDWHLARARAAGHGSRIGQRTVVEPVLEGLLRLFVKLHADRQVQVHRVPAGGAVAFAGETQDLQEMLGNALDNAFKWARSTVRLTKGPYT